MKLGRQAFSILAAALLASTGSLAAQSADEQGEPAAQQQTRQQDQQQNRQATPAQAQSRPAAPRHLGPTLSGTVVKWNGDRIDLKTADGKTHKVAVNADTEQTVAIAPGAQVTVDYRRKVRDFIIAERVRLAEAAASATAAAPAQGSAASGAPALTGAVVSWNDAALVVKTKEGEVTFFLAPTTEYLVKSLDPGSRVVVEYSQEGSDGPRMATRVRAAQEARAKKEGND